MQHFVVSQHAQNAPMLYRFEAEELMDSLKYEIIALESRCVRATASGAFVISYLLE